MDTHSEFLVTAWNFQRIEKVEITSNLFLTCLKPSKFINYSEVVVDKNFFNYIREVNESCDPFTLCITGNNSVGRSNTSCINGSLPYVPSEDMISYSISLSQGSYTLSVTKFVLWVALSTCFFFTNMYFCLICIKLIVFLLKLCSLNIILTLFL